MIDNTVRQDLSYRLDKLYIYLSETGTPGMRSYDAIPTYHRPDGSVIESERLFPDGAKCMPGSFDVKETDWPELHTKAIHLDTIADLLPNNTALELEQYEAVGIWYRSKASIQTDQERQRIDDQRWWTELIGYGSLFEHNVAFREKMLYHITGSSEAGRIRPPRYRRGKFRTPDSFTQDEGFLTFWDNGAEEPTYTLLGEVRFGVTYDGWPVLLPPEVEIGDKVVFVCGIETPFVFRATVDFRYQIVGQAHVMSLMWWWNEVPEAIKDKGG